LARWEDNIKTDLKGTDCDEVECTRLSQSRAQR